MNHTLIFGPAHLAQSRPPTVNVGGTASVVGAQHLSRSGQDAAPHLGTNFADGANAASTHQSPITSHHLAAYAAFERAANADLERTVGAAIDRTLAQALPVAQPLLAEHRGNLATTTQAGVPALLERLAAAIRAEVEKSLQGDRQLGEQVAQILAPRRLNDETRAQVVRLIGDRAHQLVPGAAKRVLNEWTQTTLASHRVRSSRADASSSRREVEAARPSGEQARSDSRALAAADARHGAAGSRPATSGSRRLDYRRLSDEQILEL